MYFCSTNQGKHLQFSIELICASKVYCLFCGSSPKEKVWRNYITVRYDHSMQCCHNGMRWRLKSSASRWFDQPLFRRKSKKTLKLRVTGLCEGDSPVTGEFPAQRASNAEDVSIWWRHHVSHKRIFDTRSSAFLALLVRNPPVTCVSSPYKREALIFFSMFTETNW